LSQKYTYKYPDKGDSDDDVDDNNNNVILDTALKLRKVLM
jgi:hypothetical protein